MSRRKKAREQARAESNHTKSKYSAKPAISKYAAKQFDTAMGAAFLAAKRGK